MKRGAPLKTHCKRGHPLAGDNLYVIGGRRPRRMCRECKLIRYRRFDRSTARVARIRRIAKFYEMPEGVSE